MLLELVFVKRHIVQKRELQRMACQRMDQSELADDKRDHESETRFFREFERDLGFALGLAKRNATDQQVRYQVSGAIARMGKIADGA